MADIFEKLEGERKSRASRKRVKDHQETESDKLRKSKRSKTRDDPSNEGEDAKEEEVKERRRNTQKDREVESLEEEKHPHAQETDLPPLKFPKGRKSRSIENTEKLIYQLIRENRAGNKQLVDKMLSQALSNTNLHTDMLTSNFDIICTAYEEKNGVAYIPTGV